MAKKKLKVGVCYWVEWIDAYSGPNTWQTSSEIDDLFGDDYTVWTLGWLQKETKNYFIFASTVVSGAYNDNKGSVWAIPKGMIIKVKEVGYD